MRDALSSGGRKDQQPFTRFLIERKTGMTFGDFQVDSTSMDNETTCHVQQMKAQSLEPSRPPRTGQALSFHDREDVVGQHIQAEPSGIGKESFTGHAAARQIIFQNVNDFLYGPAPLPLPAQQSFPSQLHILETTAK